MNEIILSICVFGMLIVFIGIPIYCICKTQKIVKNDIIADF